jgi:O-antigen/teichoic acid export membrane protein
LQAFARAATLVVLLWTRDVALLLFAVAISAVLPLGAAVRRLLRHPSSASAPATTVDVEYLPAAIEIEAIPNRAGHALTLLAICTISFPTVGDVILVRHSYSSKEAGLYAGMALVGRCVLFLALAVNAVIYPRLVGARTDSQRRGLRRKSLLLSASLCGAAALLLGAAPHLTLLVFAGAAYSEASALLRAYVLGCLAFAIVATYVYYLLAMTRAKLLLALLVPALAAQVMLPLLINANVRVLVIATMAVALGLLFICVAVTHATDP